MAETNKERAWHVAVSAQPLLTRDQFETVWALAEEVTLCENTDGPDVRIPLGRFGQLVAKWATKPVNLSSSPLKKND